MDALRWLFSLVVIFKVVHPEDSSWTITSPSSVSGVLGSYVVIPCTFNYPNTTANISVFTGSWLDERKLPIFHSVSSKTMEQYRGRTQLLGDLRQRNCSLKISPLKLSDRGQFYFRIEMQDYEKYSYVANPVTIIIMSAPMNVKVESNSVVEGESVKLKCTSDGNPASSYEWHSDNDTQLHKGNVYLLSNVSRHTGTLYCTAINEIGRKKSAAVQLNVLYGPEIRASSSCSSEGASVKCVCMAESKPPATVQFLLPNTMQAIFEIEIHDLITIGTLQADACSFDFVYCVASNTLGTTNVTLALDANSKVQYIYIAIGVGASVIVAALLVVGIKKCNSRGGLEEVPESHRTTTREDEHPMHSLAARKDVYADAHSSSIWNDRRYGNMEAGCSVDEPIYGNI